MDAQLPEKLSSANLHGYINTAEMRAQLVAQIAKDLNLEDFTFDTSATDFFARLEEGVREIMQATIHNSPSALANIVYRVDLHEAKTRELLSGPDLKADQALATAIIEREMKKVVIRNLYSGKLSL
jgi:hypothetical protein